MSADRLVTRALLEKLSLEASGISSEDLYESVSILLTTEATLGGLGQATGALHALVEGAASWVREIEGQTDPRPEAVTSPARLKEMLLALSNNLSVTNELVDAMLGALPQDGAQ